MPVRLKAFGIDKKSSARLAELCTFGKQRTVKSYVELGYEEIREIFEECFE